MSTGIKKEEYSTLGDFIRVSFVRDQSVILVRYPRLDAVFLTKFTTQLEAVKVLESGLVLTEEQKAVTKQLYAESDELNLELNFLSSYITDAGLSPTIVSALKKDLKNDNIEAAVLKIESLKQYVVANSAVLEAEGMAAAYPTMLDDHKISLSAKNVLQNTIMNNRKSLTDANVEMYKDLYKYIGKIARAGKLVFATTVVKDEYIISKIVGRMRAAARAVAPPV